MHRLPPSLALIAAFLVCAASPLLAQQKRVSPHETISKGIDDNLVMVVYGRPYTKDPKSGEARKIWGDVVPFGKVWRMGADEATLLVSANPLTLGDTTVPAGAYELFMLPMEDGSAKLIINKQVGEWGAYTYDEKQDLARIDLKKEAVSSPVDQFTIAIDKGEKGSGAGTLKFMWADAAYALPFTVKK